VIAPTFCTSAPTTITQPAKSPWPGMTRPLVSIAYS